MTSLKNLRRDIDVDLLAKSLKKEIGGKTRLFRYIKDGPILEIGCGSGEVLNALAQAFPTAQLFGIDADERMLRLISLKRIPRCTLYASPAEEIVEIPVKCSTVIFCASLHEILSFSGLEQVRKSLENAYSYLTEGGRIIIWEGIKPNPMQVMVPENSPASSMLIRFVQRFSFTRFDIISTPHGDYILPFQAIAEFVSKRRKLTVPLEYRETHFPLSESQYIDFLRSVGFRILTFEKDALHEPEIRYAKIKLGIKDDIDKIDVYGLIVGEK